jgi:hypothetical protein
VGFVVVVVVVVVHGVNHRKTKSARKKTGNTQRKLHEKNQPPPLYEYPRRILNFPLSPIYSFTGPPTYDTTVTDSCWKDTNPTFLVNIYQIIKSR